MDDDSDVVNETVRGILSQTTQTLAELVSRISVPSLSTAVLQISPPEFSGGPEDDVYEWLDRFERSTTGLPVEQRKTLLGKSFIRSAKSWFKDDLMPQLSSNDWASIKRIILDRFSGQDQEDRYFDRLSSLTFDDRRHGSISSFSDEYIHTYRRAYPKAEEGEVVRAMVRAIPKQYKGYLNMLTKLKSINTIKELKDTLKYYDQDVKISQPNEAREAIDIHKLKEVMADAVKTMVAEQSKKTEEVIAAFAKPQNYRRYNYNQGYNNGYPRNNAKNISNNSNRANVSQGPQPGSYYNKKRVLSRSNIRRGIKPPPRPCDYCGLDHWNADCPTRNQNLSHQGC